MKSVIFGLPKDAVLHCETPRFALKNVPFRILKRHVLQNNPQFQAISSGGNRSAFSISSVFEVLISGGGRRETGVQTDVFQEAGGGRASPSPVSNGGERLGAAFLLQDAGFPLRPAACRGRGGWHRHGGLRAWRPRCGGLCRRAGAGGGFTWTRAGLAASLFRAFPLPFGLIVLSLQGIFFICMDFYQ